MVYLCREQYQRDSDAIEGIERGLEHMRLQEQEPANSDDEDADDGVGAEVDASDTAGGAESLPGSCLVEFEAFPKYIVEELERLRAGEEDMARTFDHVPTSLGEQNRALDQFGIRIQKRHAHRTYFLLSGRQRSRRARRR